MTKQHVKRRYPVRPQSQNATTTASGSSPALLVSDDKLGKKICDLLKAFPGEQAKGRVDEVDRRLEQVAFVFRHFDLSEAPIVRDRRENLQAICECLTEMMDRVYPVGATTFDADGFAMKLKSQGILTTLFDLVAHRAKTLAHDAVLLKLVILMTGLQHNAKQPTQFCSESAIMDLARFCLEPMEGTLSPPDKDDLVRIRAMSPLTGFDGRELPEHQLMSLIGVSLLTNMCKATATSDDNELAIFPNLIATSDLLPVLIDLAIGDAAKKAPSLMEAAVNLMDHVLSSRMAQNCDKITTDVIVRTVDKCVEFHNERIGPMLFTVLNHVTKSCAATNFLDKPENWATFKKLLDLAQSRKLTGDFPTMCVSSLTNFVDRCDSAVLESARSQKMDDGELVLVRVATWFRAAYSPTASRTVRVQRMFLGLFLSFLCQHDQLNLAMVKNVIATGTPNAASVKLAQMSEMTGRVNAMQRKEWAAKKRPCSCSVEQGQATRKKDAGMDSLIQGIRYMAANAFVD